MLKAPKMAAPKTTLLKPKKITPQGPQPKVRAMPKNYKNKYIMAQAQSTNNANGRAKIA